MKPLVVNTDFLTFDIAENDPLFAQAAQLRQQLYDKRGKGNDFMGWVDYIQALPQSLLTDINQTAQQIRQKADVLLVLGIGGSYLGSKSALSALLPYFNNEKIIAEQRGTAVYFLGHQMSTRYIAELLEHIKGKSCVVNVISKSGTTTETAVAFRLVKQFMMDSYGADYHSRIIATTDKAHGALKHFADEMSLKRFVIPDDIGGRYSVFTPVGLLPMAVMGVAIDEMLRGASAAYQDIKTRQQKDNPAFLYAVARNKLYRKGFKSEVLVNYEPALNDIAEWWKQLFGESEGKEGKGLLPHAMSFTTDLHSLGQYIQEGERLLFETVIALQTAQDEIMISTDQDNLDGLNYLAGKSIFEINQTAMMATILAHNEGGVPNIVLELAKNDAYHIGYLYYFFMMACAISGGLLGVNPFNQPGVEAYKKNMFALLGKAGFEAQREQLLEKLPDQF